MESQNLRIFLSLLTVGSVGKKPIGRFLSPLIAFPLLIIYKLVYFLNPYSFYLLLLTTVLFSIVALAMITGKKQSFPEELSEKQKEVVLDRIFGMAFAFVKITMRFKLIIFGFIFFSVLRFLLVESIDSDRKNIYYSVAVSMLSGFIVNILLRFMIWLVY
jgi:phosphatidylglycerophosphatase A